MQEFKVENNDINTNLIYELKENEDLYNKINKCFFYNSDKIKKKQQIWLR